jgi:1-acyl-sn-glycerol-3-phosphate acyltransferase
VRRTIFNTPLISQFFTALSWLGLRAAGWRTEGTPPAEGKYVLIAAPHTSNWDFPLMLATAFVFRIDIFWMGKESLFPFPLATLMKWLGGIPIDRSKSQNVVEQMIEIYSCNEKLVVAIPPEGTRSKVKSWKTGFYHIAAGANVPIASGFLDYGRKVSGFGPHFYPTGDLDQDLKKMQAFYRGVTGKYPSKLGLNEDDK